MEYNFSKEVKLFMIFDILGDTERTGTLLWKIDRKKLEDVKNHTMDLIFMIRILRRHFPSFLNFDLIYDYGISHDIPEAITGDLTKFEGISSGEIDRVTRIAKEFLSNTFKDIMDFEKLLNEYENKINIESKIVNMIDKLLSSTTITKYQSEKNIDVFNPKIDEKLRNMFIEEFKAGKDLADIFFEYHFPSIKITDEECEKYKISRSDADQIVNVIKAFANEMYSMKQKGTLLVKMEEFPKEAMIYNRRIKSQDY